MRLFHKKAVLIAYWKKINLKNDQSTFMKQNIKSKSRGLMHLFVFLIEIVLDFCVRNWVG